MVFRREKKARDWIEMFKIMRRLDKVDEEKLFLLMKGSRARGQRFNVICQRSKHNVRKKLSHTQWFRSGMHCLEVWWRQVQSRLSEGH